MLSRVYPFLVSVFAFGLGNCAPSIPSKSEKRWTRNDVRYWGGFKTSFFRIILVMATSVFWYFGCERGYYGRSRKTWIRNEVLWNPAEIKLLQILPSHKCYFVLLRDSNVAKTFAVPRSGPIWAISALNEQGLSESMSRIRIKPKSYCVRTLKLFRCGLRSQAEELRSCQNTLLKNQCDGYKARLGIYLLVLKFCYSQEY